MSQDQQREAAWIALHTPATDAAHLAHIASAHPEFATAIRAHPNAYPELRAWAEAALHAAPKPKSQFAAPTQQNAEAWHTPGLLAHRQPKLEQSWDYSQYTHPPLVAPDLAPRFPSQLYAQPGLRPAPAPQAVWHPSIQQPQPSHMPHLTRDMHPQAALGRIARDHVNVLGIIALSLLAMIALTSFVTPFAQRSALSAGVSPVMLAVFPLVTLALTLVAVGLSLGGVLQHSANRLRWTAIGALVAGVLEAVTIVTSLLGSWALSLF